MLVHMSFWHRYTISLCLYIVSSCFIHFLGLWKEKHGQKKSHYIWIKVWSDPPQTLRGNNDPTTNAERSPACWQNLAAGKLRVGGWSKKKIAETTRNTLRVESPHAELIDSFDGLIFQTLHIDSKMPRFVDWCCFRGSETSCGNLENPMECCHVFTNSMLTELHLCHWNPWSGRLRISCHTSGSGIWSAIYPAGWLVRLLQSGFLRSHGAPPYKWPKMNR